MQDESTTTEPHRDRRRGLLLAGTTTLLWCTVPPTAAFALQRFDAAFMASARLLFAAGVLALILARKSPRELRLPAPSTWLAGAFLAGNYLLFFLGLARTGPAAGHLIMQLAPLFLVALSVLVLGERLTRRQVFGTALLAAGLGLVAWNGGSIGAAENERFTRGFLLLVASALSWSVYALLQKRLAQHQPTEQSMVWIFAGSGLLLLPLARTTGLAAATAVDWIALGYTAVCTLVAYWCFAASLRHLEASRVAMVTAVSPVGTLLLVGFGGRLGWFSGVHETVSVWKVLGALAVVAGVISALRDPTETRPIRAHLPARSRSKSP